jgi:hypothetical protein
VGITDVLALISAPARSTARRGGGCGTKEEAMKLVHRWKLVLPLLAMGALVACVLSASASASVDPGQRTVTAGAFQVQWSQTDPEEILSLSWSGSPNLTNSATNPFCPQGGDHEFFGDSWDTFSDVNFRALVGWGSTGTWDSRDRNGVAVASAASGCFGTSGIPVHTSYQFFDHGNEVNRILVQRRISFGTTPFGYDLRAYIPRLYPRDQYSLVIHPNASGTDLVTEIGNDCEFGCEVTNWNGTWFAVHDPVSGRGMIVRHASSSNPVALWVDMDGASQTTASGVLLVQPLGGFTGTVVETESLCFYDSGIWSPSLTLPAGC